MPGLLCLKWNNHYSAFDKLLNNLHLKEVYSDGTLICHGKFYPIHKFVLSTCSEYFEEVFNRILHMDCKHPFIIVKDIQPSQMEALLNYMYRGEVNVPQEMLPDLIKAAEAFRIKGLAVPDDEPPPSKSSTKDRKRSSVSPSPHVKKSRKLEDRNSRNNKSNIGEIDVGTGSSVAYTEIDNDNIILLEKCKSSDSEENDEGGLGRLKYSESGELFKSNLQSHGDLDLVKTELIDPCSYADEEADQVNNPLEDFMPLKDQNIKEEDQSYSSYTSAEHFPPYSEESEPGTENQFDVTQMVGSHVSSDSHLQKTFGTGAGRITPPIAADQTQLLLKVKRTCATPSTMGVSKEKPLKGFTSSKPYHCDFCSYCCCTNNELKIHVRKHTGEKPYKCTYCPYKSSQNANLQTHLKIHTGEKPYQCHICTYRSSQNGNLQTHLKTHTGEKPYQCPQCPYRAVQKQNLFNHMLRHSC